MTTLEAQFAPFLERIRTAADRIREWFAHWQFALKYG